MGSSLHPVHSRCSHIVVCAGANRKSLCGVDLHNQTTADFSKNGSYSAHVFTDEAVRLINKQVTLDES